MGRKGTENHNYQKSKGQTLLCDVLQELSIPGQSIKQDVNLHTWSRNKGYVWKDIIKDYGNDLGGVVADIFLETAPYPLVLEYHGRQHYEFVQYFHGNEQGFMAHKERDRQKEWLCQRLGIILVVFGYYEDIEHDFVLNKINDAIASFKMPGEFVSCPKCHLWVYPEELSEAGCRLCKKKEESKPKISKATEEQKQKFRVLSKRHRDEFKKSDSYMEKKKNDKELKKKQPRPVVDESKKEAARLYAKEQRRKKREEMKESPYYLEQKEKQARYNAEQRQKQKEYMKKQKNRPS